MLKVEFPEIPKEWQEDLICEYAMENQIKSAKSVRMLAMSY